MTGSGFYAESKSKEAGVTVTRSPTVRIGMSAGVVRMLAWPTGLRKLEAEVGRVRGRLIEAAQAAARA